MSVRLEVDANPHILSGAEGELVSVRVKVRPRLLEDLLETLATVGFPVNPQIRHGDPTLVEFPAYGKWVPPLKSVLARHGFGAEVLEIHSMLDVISQSS